MRDYYRVCDHCGAALDPGERCECQRIDKAEKPEKIRYINKIKDKEVKAV